jgi:hypothetical protein
MSVHGVSAQYVFRSLPWNLFILGRVYTIPQSADSYDKVEVLMGFGRGVLFWLLGIPIPIIILLALFWHN